MKPTPVIVDVNLSLNPIASAIPDSTLMIVIQPTMQLSDEEFQRLQISVESIRQLLPPHVPVVLLENASIQLIDANDELRNRIEALEQRL